MGFWTATLATWILGTKFSLLLILFVRSVHYTLHTVLVLTLVWSGALTAICFVIKNTLAGLLFLKVFLIAVILIIFSLPHLSMSFALLRMSAKHLLNSGVLIAVIVMFAFFGTALLILPFSATLVSIFHFNNPTVDSNLGSSYSLNVFFITLLVVLAVLVFWSLRYLVHYAAAHVFARSLALASTPVDTESESLISTSSVCVEHATLSSTLGATLGGGMRTIGTAVACMFPNTLMLHIYHRLSLCAPQTFHQLYIERARAYSVYGVSLAAGAASGHKSLSQASNEAFDVFERANRAALPEHSVVASVLMLCSLTIAVLIGALTHVIYQSLLKYRDLDSVGTWFGLIVGALFGLFVMVSLLEALEAGCAAILLRVAQAESTSDSKTLEQFADIVTELPAKQ
jgi:hypothetical protein